MPHGHAAIRRYTVPGRGFPPFMIAYGANKDPIRVIIRNEGSGSDESVIPLTSQNFGPIFPFGWMAIGGAGGPLSLPPVPLQGRSLLLSTEFNDLIYASGTCFVLNDGGQNVLVLSPEQTLYATSADANAILVSVEIVNGLVDQDTFLLVD